MKLQRNKGYLQTKEEKMIKDAVHEFAKNEIRLAAVECDKQTDSKKRIPWAELNMALSSDGLGLGMAFIPADHGGFGYGLRELSLIVEELAWGDLGFVYTAMGNMHSVPCIVSKGTVEQKRRLFPEIPSISVPP